MCQTLCLCCGKFNGGHRDLGQRLLVEEHLESTELGRGGSARENKIEESLMSWMDESLAKMYEKKVEINTTVCAGKNIESMNLDQKAQRLEMNAKR